MEDIYKRCLSCGSKNVEIQDSSGNFWSEICCADIGVFTCECGSFRGVNNPCLDDNMDHQQGNTMFCMDCNLGFCLDCESEIKKVEEEPLYTEEDWREEVQDEQHKEFLSKYRSTKKKGAPTRKNKKYDDAECLVYFIQEKGGGFIKIGYTENINARLSQMQTNSPHDLVILSIIEAGKEKEKQIHEKFRNHHHRGEWFYPSGEIMEYINYLNNSSRSEDT